MRERPILMSAPMVRALLAGTKTQTRRAVKNAYAHWQAGQCHILDAGPTCWNIGGRVFSCPHGRLGDRLWVKETHAFYSLNYHETGKWHPSDPGVCCHYREGCMMELADRIDKWRPSIFMPRWASRITLELTAVRVERLNDISEEDAKAEGASRKIWITSPMSAGAMNARGEYGTHRDGYKDIWESINGAGSWAQNPWVWVLSFRVLNPQSQST